MKTTRYSCVIHWYQTIHSHRYRHNFRRCLMIWWLDIQYLVSFKLVILTYWRISWVYLYIVIEKVNDYFRHYCEIYTKGYSIKQGYELGYGLIVYLYLSTLLFHNALLHFKKIVPIWKLSEIACLCFVKKEYEIFISLLNAYLLV